MGSHCKGTAGQDQPVPFAELGAMVEHVAAYLAQAFENAQSALDGQTDFPAQAAGQGMDERRATPYQGLGAIDLEIHQRRPVDRPALLCDVVLADLEVREIG